VLLGLFLIHRRKMLHQQAVDEDQQHVQEKGLVAKARLHI
jgi:hypothetical protein